MDKSDSNGLVVLSPCNDCVNRISATNCKSFERIPDEILKGKNDHTKPYKGDHGIQFKKK